MDVKSDITMPIAGVLQITLICPDPHMTEEMVLPQSLLLSIKRSHSCQCLARMGQVATSIMNIGSVVYPLIILMH